MKITLMHNNTFEQMMGIIIVTKNGRVIAVDGGTRGDTPEFRRLIAERGGKIDLWLLTHPHHDHHDVFVGLSKNKDSDLKVGTVCYSPAGKDFVSNEPNGLMKDIEQLNEVMANPFYNTIVVNQGDRFEVDNVTVDVLRVVNPAMNPATINDLSVVYRITEKKDDGTEFRFMILGDLYVPGGQELLELYKDNLSELKADAVQMAHHGQNGVERNVYDAIGAKYTFWATPDWLWTNTPGGGAPGTGPWKTLEVRKWMEEMGAVAITVLTHNAEFDTENIGGK